MRSSEYYRLHVAVRHLLRKYTVFVTEGTEWLEIQSNSYSNQFDSCA